MPPFSFSNSDFKSDWGAYYVTVTVVDVIVVELMGAAMRWREGRDSDGFLGRREDLRGRRGGGERYGVVKKKVNHKREEKML